jgi:hypothetical protein
MSSSAKCSDGVTPSYQARRTIAPAAVASAACRHAQPWESRAMTSKGVIRVEVERKVASAANIASFELSTVDDAPLPAFGAGAYIDVHSVGFAAAPAGAADAPLLGRTGGVGRGCGIIIRSGAVH